MSAIPGSSCETLGSAIRLEDVGEDGDSYDRATRSDPPARGRPRWQGFFRPVWLVHGNLGVWETIRTGRSAVFHPLCPGVARTLACTPDLVNLGRWTKQEGTTVSVFLILGIAGVMVLLVSLILGDLLDSALHFDGLDSEVFSTSVIAAFVGAFGFGGVAVHEFTDSVWLASLVGLVAGSLAGWGAVALTRWLKRAETGQALRSDHLVGAEARVITDIPEGGFGEIRIGTHKRAARAELPIPAGTPVWVSGVLSPTAVEVRPTADEPPQY